MLSDNRLNLFVTLLLAVVVVISVKINSALRFPYPPFTQLVFDLSEEFSKKVSYERPLGSEGGFRDFTGVLLGMRRLTADIAWISVLQYYGSHEQDEHEDGHEHNFGGGKYYALKKMVLRVVRLDPSLYYGYLYGAGALAWGLDRPDEAMELLQEGIRNNPTYWQFRLYVAAIVYKKKGQFDNMINLLEDAIQYPDCPTLVKSVLGNIYKDRKNYKRALEIWMNIYEGNDLSYRGQAEKQIANLRQKLGITMQFGFPQ